MNEAALEASITRLCTDMEGVKSAQASLEISVARLGTDMDWVKSALQDIKTTSGCRDCVVSKDLDEAISDRKEAISTLRQEFVEFKQDVLETKRARFNWVQFAVQSFVALGAVAIAIFKK